MHKNGQQEDELLKLYEQVKTDVGEGVRLVSWAEDEIGEAMLRHPAQADAVFHSFSLLLPTVGSKAWATEFVVRGHARELLDRVGTAGNTKRGTAAECCMVMAEVAAAVPLNGAAAGFYLRMWSQAFPDHILAGDRLEHHEALYAAQIDDLERDVRHKLTVPSRRLEAFTVECDGEHWGEPVACRYAVQAERRAS